MSEKFYSLFLEFEEQKTMEAKFAKAIDCLDAQIQEADYKDDWKGWTKEFLVNTMEQYFIPFPKIFSVFRELVDFFEKNGYFD